MIDNNSVRKILILAANPKSTSPLRLDQELRGIAEGLQRSQHRSKFRLEPRLAVRPRDIQRAMLDINPHIVHFSGHGAGHEGLVFENEVGQAQLVDGQALAGLFQLFADQVECVVLNGCYSLLQAEAIAQHIEYVIGMNKAIGDRAAIAFAVGFYDALGAGRSIEFAYKVGCNAIQIEGISEYLTPHIIKRANDENTSYQVNSAQLINDTTQVPPSTDQRNSNEITPDERDANLLLHEKLQFKARSRLLERVASYVEGALRTRLGSAIPINLLLEEHSELVEPIYVSNIKIRRSFASFLPTETKLVEVFDRKDVGGKLLILGTPGSGKTTAQLILVRQLIQRALSNIDAPIPVIFNLASWQGERQTISSWIVSELKSKYGVRERISRAWLDHEQLLPCLDGLDEMEPSRQRRCIHFINQFQRYDTPRHLIVCCRLEEYKKSGILLELNTAVCLQPLPENEIYNYLVSVNRVELFDALQANTKLIDLVKTPLFLFLLTSVYERSIIETWSSTDSYQESCKHLFNEYIDESLHERHRSNWYWKKPTSMNTKRWLAWLATKLEKYSQTEFLIEKMQPTWLDSKVQRWAYYSLVCAATSLTVLPIWILIGLLINYILLEDYSKDSAILGGLIISSLLGISTGLLITEIQPIETLKFPGRELLNEVRFASWGDRLFSFGFFAHIQGMSNLRQSVNRQIDSLPFPNLVRLALSPLADPLSYLIRGIIGFIVPIGGFIRGLFLGARGPSMGVEKKVTPNQAIKISAFNSIRYALIFGLIGITLGAMLGWASPTLELLLAEARKAAPEQTQTDEENQPSGFSQNEAGKTQDRRLQQIQQEAHDKEAKSEVIRKRQGRTLRYLPFVLGLVGVMFGGLIAGLACIQHFALRMVLVASGSIPFRYVRFLNYATERLLLQRIGGRYQFIHELLRKHFANT